MNIFDIFIESFVVGCYVSILYEVVKKSFMINGNVLYFIVGFLKHLLGYYIGLHHIFCIYRNKQDNLYPNYLIIQCIIEGFVFLCVFNVVKNPFISGVVVHLMAEYVGLHDMFMLNSCI
jgi:hypothetical protein